MNSNIYNSVLKKIVPSKEEQDNLNKSASLFVEKLRSSLNEHSAKIIIGGSLSKNT